MCIVYPVVKTPVISFEGASANWFFLQSAGHTCKLVSLTTGNAWHWYSEENKSFYDKIISAKGVRKNKNTFDQRLAYFILFKTHCTKCFNKAV